MTTWGEDRRLELSIHHALEDASLRMKKLTGKDKYALQQEFLEWTSVQDHDELDIHYLNDFNSWE